MKVYTVGYLKPDTMETLQRLHEQDVLIVDIRRTPASRMPEWNGDNLKQQFQEGGYMWLKALGKLYQGIGYPIKLHDEAQGLTVLCQLLSKGVSICLLCSCSTVNRCHRRYVAQRLTELLPGLEVEQL